MNRGLALGNLELYPMDLPKPIMAYFRNHKDQNLFVAHNLSDQALTLAVPKDYEIQLYSLGMAKSDAGSISMPPYSSIVLEK